MQNTTDEFGPCCRGHSLAVADTISHWNVNITAVFCDPCRPKIFFRQLTIGIMYTTILFDKTLNR